MISPGISLCYSLSLTLSVAGLGQAHLNKSIDVVGTVRSYERGCGSQGWRRKGAHHVPARMHPFVHCNKSSETHRYVDI